MLRKTLSDNLLISYRKNLKQNRLNEQKQFFGMLNKNFISRLKRKHKVILPFLSEIDSKKANKYIDKSKNNIKKLLNQGTIKKRQLHELRKRLKILDYNIKSLTSGNKKSLAKKSVLPVLLGKWHDNQVMLAHLNKEIKSRKINLKEIHYLEKVRMKISSGNEVLLNKINYAIRTSEYLQKLNQ